MSFSKIFRIDDLSLQVEMMCLLDSFQLNIRSDPEAVVVGDVERAKYGKVIRKILGLVILGLFEADLYREFYIKDKYVYMWEMYVWQKRKPLDFQTFSVLAEHALARALAFEEVF